MRRLQIDVHSASPAIAAGLLILQPWLQHADPPIPVHDRSPSCSHSTASAGAELADERHLIVRLECASGSPAGSCEEHHVNIGPGWTAERIAAAVVAVVASQLCRDSCSGVVVVGALTKPSRSADLCARRILHLNAMDGVLHVPVSPAMRLAEQALLCVPATAHVLLVKATDFMGVDASGLPVFDEQLQQIVEEARQAGCAIVDPLASIAIVADRLRTRQALSGIEAATRGRVQLPLSHSVQTREELSELCSTLEAADRQQGGSRLWLVKPRVACGVDESHEMCLVTSPSALLQAVRCNPVVVEEFRNHGGEQLKCYVAGASVFVHRKLSFPDVVGTSADGTTCHIGDDVHACQERHILRFHSLRSMPQAQGPLEPRLKYGEALVRQCAREISASTGLSVFGFDLIQPSGQGGWLLIDCNAFPSFKGVPDAPSALRRCLREAAIANVHGSS